MGSTSFCGAAVMSPAAFPNERSGCGPIIRHVFVHVVHDLLAEQPHTSYPAPASERYCLKRIRVSSSRIAAVDKDRVSAQGHPADRRDRHRLADNHDRASE